MLNAHAKALNGRAFKILDLLRSARHRIDFKMHSIVLPTKTESIESGERHCTLFQTIRSENFPLHSMVFRAESKNSLTRFDEYNWKCISHLPMFRTLVPFFSLKSSSNRNTIVEQLSGNAWVVAVHSTHPFVSLIINSSTVYVCTWN